MPIGKPLPHPQVADRVIDGQAVIVLSDTGDVLILNEGGTWLWERLDGQRTVEELAVALSAEFEVSMDQGRADLQELLEELLRRGAIVMGD